MSNAASESVSEFFSEDNEPKKDDMFMKVDGETKRIFVKPSEVKVQDDSRYVIGNPTFLEDHTKKFDEADWAHKCLNMEHQELLKEVENSWMLQKCSHYHDEYRVCKNLKSRVNQFFRDGVATDCNNMYSNYTDCKEFVNNRDVGAAKRVIERESVRINKRLEGHAKNDVWEKRDGPISKEEWRPELPKELQDNVETSLMKQYIDGESDMKINSIYRFAQFAECCIS